MHYVYFLKSTKYDFLYVGKTGDLKKRLLEHNDRKVQSTKFYVPLKLIYYEAYIAKYDADTREYSLKHHGNTIGHLKKRLARSLSKGF